MARDQLFADTGADILHRERAALGFHLRVQRDLKQHVAQFLAKKGTVAQVDGVHHLVGLFNEILPDAGVCLLLVPRAPVGGVAQQRDNGAQVVHCEALPLRPRAKLFVHGTSLLFPARRPSS